MKPYSKAFSPYLSISMLPLISFQITSFVIPWLITIWYTYNAELAAAGNFSFILAMISPLCILLAAPSRNFLLIQNTNLTDALFSRLLLILVGSLAVLLLGYYFHAAWLFTVLFLFKAGELLYDLPISQAIKKQSSRQLWRLSLSKWLIILLLTLLAYVIASIEQMLLIGFLCFLTVIRPLIKQRCAHTSASKILVLIRQSLPLSLSTLIFAVHFNIPRYILASFDHDKILAIYAISSFLIMAAIVLVNIYIQAKLPLLKKIHSNNIAQFRHEMLKISVLFFTIYGGLQLAQLPLISDYFWQLHNNVQLQQPEYYKIYQQTLALAGGSIIFSLANYFLMLTGQHKTLLAITSGNLLFTILICFFSIKYFDFFTLLVSYNIGCLLQCLLVGLVFNPNRDNND